MKDSIYKQFQETNPIVIHTIEFAMKMGITKEDFITKFIKGLPKEPSEDIVELIGYIYSQPKFN
jgi:hypothetical protein